MAGASADRMAALKTRGLPRILSYLTMLYGIVLVLEFAVHPFMNVV